MPKVITHGYDDSGDCSRCHSKHQGLSRPYEKDEEQYQDVYCENCGAVLEVKEVEECS